MFIGRQQELNAIKQILTRPSGSVLIYGKRKIGKTTLILEALKNSSNKTIYYECLKTSLEDNIEGFVSILLNNNILPVRIKFLSFQDVFKYLNTLGETFNIVIDEYPYLKQFVRSETIDSIFQTIIDNNLANIRLFLSGSHVGMMKDLLDEKNALYGRFSLIINLKELNYKEASAFYLDKNSYEKVGFYAVFGGSPYVCEQLDNKSNLRENIIKIILNHLSSVYAYADNLLISDLTNSINAERIFLAIGNGKKKYSEIEGRVGLASNGLLSKHLKGLLSMDMIKKVYPINRPNDSKKTSYELTDNLLRFWYTYIYKNKGTLQVLGAEAFYDNYIAPTITNFISYRFEDIVRIYFSLEVREGRRKGILDIGSYYYDDSYNKTNGEFDVALKRKGGYDIYEVKYLKSPLKDNTMREEEKQIRAIKGFNVLKIGFVSINGFEKKPLEYECIDGDMLY